MKTDFTIAELRELYSAVRYRTDDHALVSKLAELLTAAIEYEAGVAAIRRSATP